jgi:hypothetical protein
MLPILPSSLGLLPAPRPRAHPEKLEVEKPFAHAHASDENLDTVSEPKLPFAPPLDEGKSLLLIASART